MERWDPLKMTGGGRVGFMKFPEMHMNIWIYERGFKEVVYDC